MRINGSTTPDQYGQLEFVGLPSEVQEGDIMLAAGNEYAVRDAPKKANNFGKPATELVLAEAGEYGYEAPRGGLPESYARITLNDNMQVRFKRTVVTDGLDFGEEAQLFWELVDCEDPDDPETNIDDDHYGHGAYQTEWNGKLRDAPKGMLVGINLEPEGKPVKPSCKILDTVFDNGAVVFSDGTSYQSHPDKTWVGWVKS